MTSDATHSPSNLPAFCAAAILLLIAVVGVVSRGLRPVIPDVTVVREAVVWQPAAIEIPESGLPAQTPPQP